MAGKTKKPRTSDKRGGSRVGAGRKPKEKEAHPSVKNNYLLAAAKLAKEFGMTVEEYLLRMVFDEKIQDTVKSSIMKSYNDALIAKESTRTVKHEDVGPAIGLPPSRHDPAKIIPIKGGKERKRDGTG